MWCILTWEGLQNYYAMEYWNHISFFVSEDYFRCCRFTIKMVRKRHISLLIANKYVNKSGCRITCCPLFSMHIFLNYLGHWCLTMINTNQILNLLETLVTVQWKPWLLLTVLRHVLKLKGAYSASKWKLILDYSRLSSFWQYNLRPEEGDNFYGRYYINHWESESLFICFNYRSIRVLSAHSSEQKLGLGLGFKDQSYTNNNDLEVR